jgi:CheY-like chemotaxis protein
MTLLYVEDDLDDQEIFKEVITLINPNAVCSFARSGIDALKALDESIPAIVFLDVNMPGMSGIDVLKNIKENAAMKNIPVLMYSTSQNPRDFAACKSLGAVDFLIKPSTFNETIAILKPWVVSR